MEGFPLVFLLLQAAFCSAKAVTLNICEFLLEHLQVFPMFTLVVVEVNNVVSKISTFNASKLVCLDGTVFADIL